LAEQGAVKTTDRLAFIDWTRGLAAVVMLQGHTFHSFTRPGLRDKGPYTLSQFVGGLPPAIFLLLTGITFAFLMDSQESKGAPMKKRILAALKRSRYLFILAFLFRLQLYIFGYPTSPASELLRVDILNCMGMAMLVFAPMAVFTTLERVRLCTVLGMVIAGLSPVLRTIDFSFLPSLVTAYFVPSYAGFPFFPWAAFLAFGMAMGSVIRLAKPENLERVMGWTLGVGIGLTMAAYQLANLPYSVYSKVDFWLDSPALITFKLGVVLSVLSVAYLWMRTGVVRWSLCRQLGMTSLLVYWVHIELVYGRWFGFFKEKLDVAQVVVFTLLLIALMAGLSVLRTRSRSLPSGLRSPSPVQASST
jgi:uncharacterized membrane protein